MNRHPMAAEADRIAEEWDELRELLMAARKHIKDTPKVCMNMYRGRDRVSFGEHAKALLAKIDAVRP